MLGKATNPHANYRKDYLEASVRIHAMGVDTNRRNSATGRKVLKKLIKETTTIRETSKSRRSKR